MSKQVEIEQGGKLSYEDACYLEQRPVLIEEARLQGVEDIDEQIAKAKGVLTAAEVREQVVGDDVGARITELEAENAQLQLQLAEARAENAGQPPVERDGGETGVPGEEPLDEFTGMSRPELVQRSKDAELPATGSNKELAEALRTKAAKDAK